MNLLASALPGLREIRPPLVAGYMWLLVAWLIVDPAPNLADATGVVRDVVDLSETIGTAATAAAVSVGAYLVGALQQGLIGALSTFWWSSVTVGRAFGPWELLETGVGRLRDVIRAARSGKARSGPAQSTETEQEEDAPLKRAIPPTERRPGPFKRAFEAFKEVALPRFLRRSARQRNQYQRIEQRTADFREYVGRIEGDPRRNDRARDMVIVDLPADRHPTSVETRQAIVDAWPNLTPQQMEHVYGHVLDARRALEFDEALPQQILLGDQPQLYAEADRLQGEADFRSAVVPPILALIGFLVEDQGSWCLALALAPILLARQGRILRSRARWLVRDAIEYGKVPSPALDRLKQKVEAIREAAAEAGPVAQQSSAAPEKGWNL